MRKIEEIRRRRAANAAARAKAEYDRTHATEKWEAEYQAFVQEQRELKAKRLAEKEQAKAKVVEEPVVSLDVEAPVAEKPTTKKKKSSVDVAEIKVEIE